MCAEVRGLVSPDYGPEGWSSTTSSLLASSVVNPPPPIQVHLYACRRNVSRAGGMYFHLGHGKSDHIFFFCGFFSRQVDGYLVFRSVSVLQLDTCTYSGHIPLIEGLILSYSVRDMNSHAAQHFYCGEENGHPNHSWTAGSNPVGFI